jgi:hypothetical protein
MDKAQKFCDSEELFSYLRNYPSFFTFRFSFQAENILHIPLSTSFKIITSKIVVLIITHLLQFGQAVYSN